MKASKFPGLAIGIVNRRRILCLKSFGKADDAGSPITPRTPFVIGSMSKTFTALAVLRLVEAGRLELDTPVCHYLKWFQLKDAEASRKITVRHLLNHTSGIPRSAAISDIGGPSQEADLEDYVRRLGEVDPVHVAGQAYEYSNLNYGIIGLLIQAVSQQSYEAYVRAHVLAPLKMHSTYLTHEEAVKNGLVRGCEYNGLSIITTQPSYRNHMVPFSCIVSSAEDLSRYLMAYLNGEIYSLIRPESLSLMQEPRSDIGSSYGMGWWIGKWLGIRSIKGYGSTKSFNSMALLLPQAGLGIVVLSNINVILAARNLLNTLTRRFRRTKNQEPV
jgi:CubicO group peptidase (beta-lactamase class C family)